MKKCFHNFKLVSLFLGILLFAGCSKKVYEGHEHYKSQKDSIAISTDTVYLPGTIPIHIEGESASDSSLTFNQQYWMLYSEYFDSLCAAWDSTNNPLINDTVFIKKTLGLWNSDTSLLETSLAYSTAVVKYGKLFHNLEQPEKSYKKEYDSLLMFVNTKTEKWHEKTEITTDTSKIVKSSFWDYIKYILIGVLIGWLLPKLIKLIKLII